MLVCCHFLSTVWLQPLFITSYCGEHYGIFQPECKYILGKQRSGMMKHRIPRVIIRKFMVYWAGIVCAWIIFGFEKWFFFWLWQEWLLLFLLDKKKDSSKMFSICIDLKKKWYEQIVVTQNQCCSWECIVVSPPHVLLHHSHSVYFSPGSWSPAHPSHQHRTVFCHRGLRRAALASGHTLLTWCEPCDLGNLSSHSGVFNISTFISLILQVFFFSETSATLETVTLRPAVCAALTYQWPVSCD